jgi:hypothetical protein
MSEKSVNRAEAYQKPSATVSFKDVMREINKKAKNIDYLMHELVGQEIVITSVDLANNTCKAFVGDKLVTVGWKSKTISKHMAIIDKFIRTHYQGVRVKVVEKISRKTGNTYLDFE